MTPSSPRRFQHVYSLFAAFGDMLGLAWQAQPACFAGLLLIDCVQSIIPIGHAWLTKLIFDLLAQSLPRGTAGNLPTNLILLLAGQAVLAFLNQILGTLNGYCSAELGRQLNLKVQVRVYRKINSLLGLAPFENPHIQDVIQLGTQGAQMGPNQALSILSNALHSIFTFISFLGVLLVFNPLLAGLVALVALPQLWVQIQLGGQRFDLATENSPRQRRSNYYGYLLSAVYFAKELRLFNLGEYFLGLYQRLTEEINQTQRNLQGREVRWQAVLGLLSECVAVTAFVIVVLRAFGGGLSLGDVTLYTNAVGALQSSMAGIVYALARTNESALFFSRYTELMALPQSIHIPEQPRAIAPLRQGIELRNVSFRYSADHPWVLRNVNLQIPAGSCLAVVGLNGAGKTTLVKLLSRFYEPTEGEILWDGINLREFDPIALRRQMGAIFQDFSRFDMTAFENIAIGDVEKLQGEKNILALVQLAAEKAGVQGTIEALPQGYQTILSRWLAEEGEGVDLSGGEWQKIALARMFLRSTAGANFLILDEPTAALDAQAEYDVYNRFVELMAGKTSLLISHRFSTVRMATKIAVLEDGQVSEYGSHPELIQAAGTYARLYNLQAERYR